MSCSGECNFINGRKNALVAKHFLWTSLSFIILKTPIEIVRTMPDILMKGCLMTNYSVWLLGMTRVADLGSAM